MDADNRVVLNCGGIRHEVYKVGKMARSQRNKVCMFLRPL